MALEIILQPGRRLHWFFFEMPTTHKFWLAVISLALPSAVLAIPPQGDVYVLETYVIAGGGSTASNGSYIITGTIGQHGAAATVSNGGYQLGGGFWGLGIKTTTPADRIFNDDFE